MTERVERSGGPSSVAVVVTNYRTWKLASHCVASARQVEPDLRDLFVVDDNSEEEEPANLDAQVERNPTRIGLVRSLDGAIRRRRTDLVVVFDSDARPVTAFVDECRRAFDEDPRLGALGFGTIDESGAPTGSYEPVPSASSLVLGQRLDGLFAHWTGRVRRRPLTVFACAMAIRRKSYEQIGGFDLGLDWLDLDHDLCMSLHEAGWRVRVSETIVAVHEGGGAAQGREERVERSYKARWRLLLRHRRLRIPGVVRAIVCTRMALEWSIASLLALAGPHATEWSAKAKGRREMLLRRSELFPSKLI